jgi:hypothetical protein
MLKVSSLPGVSVSSDEQVGSSTTCGLESNENVEVTCTNREWNTVLQIQEFIDSRP